MLPVVPRTAYFLVTSANAEVMRSVCLTVPLTVILSFCLRGTGLYAHQLFKSRTTSAKSLTACQRAPMLPLLYWICSCDTPRKLSVVCNIAVAWWSVNDQLAALLDVFHSRLQLTDCRSLHRITSSHVVDALSLYPQLPRPTTRPAVSPDDQYYHWSIDVNTPVTAAAPADEMEEADGMGVVWQSDCK